jgi:hypothetical protein
LIRKGRKSNKILLKVQEMVKINKIRPRKNGKIWILKRTLNLLPNIFGWWKDPTGFKNLSGLIISRLEN